MITLPVFAYADDREEDRLLFKMAFERAGLKNPLVLLDGGPRVQSYLQGFEQFANRTSYPFPSILFLDYKMPEVDGVQLTRWIRARSEFQKLIIVMFSGSGQQDDIDAAYAAGVNSYITKPSGLFRLSTALQAAHTYLCGVCSMPTSVA